jgi:alpha-N-arabinofuranosidase
MPRTLLVLLAAIGLPMVFLSSEPLSAASPGEDGRIVVDAAKVGQPISKYIYGQFTEHLGRCIYGGIWAEMLEDRKFFEAVGPKDSLCYWQALAAPETVSMVRDRPFVGQQTPQIDLAGDGQARGIVQGELAVRKGKRYVGRIWLCGTPQAAPVQVSLVWGDGPDDRQTVKIADLGEQYRQTALEFLAGGDSDAGRLEIASAGRGSFRVGTVSLMPAGNVEGVRPDTLALLKHLDSPVYRWPGGNFVSGYQWTDGIGPRDRRPPRKNPAWKGIEHNDYGLDEFLAFCRLLGTEPYIAVNSGLGDVKAAADEVQYANGAADTPMGKLRAKNGHPQPYGVKYWSVGNEMYGGWQLGHMPLERYVEKHNQFAEAMRKIDPSIKLIAVGSVGKWSEAMLSHCAGQMDLMSEHFYCGEKKDLAAHVRQIPDNVRRIAEAHRRYRREIPALAGKDIRVALDEWNYWYGPEVFGQIGPRYYLKDALGIAAGLNEFARQSDICFMANYAQTVNVIGCIKTRKTSAALETTGLALVLYRRHFGTLPVATAAPKSLDAQAAWSEDHKTLTLAVVNPSLKAATVPLELQGVKLRGTGKRWQIAGADPMAYNDPDEPAKVVIEETRVERFQGTLGLAPCSITLWVFPTER